MTLDAIYAAELASARTPKIVREKLLGAGRFNILWNVLAGREKREWLVGFDRRAENRAVRLGLIQLAEQKIVGLEGLVPPDVASKIFAPFIDAGSTRCVSLSPTC